MVCEVYALGFQQRLLAMLNEPMQRRGDAQKVPSTAVTVGKMISGITLLLL